MEDIYNQIRTFIVFELDPIVRMLIVGLLLIFGLFCLRDTIKHYFNTKKVPSIKLTPLIFTIIFIGLAIFIAVI